MSYIDTLKKRRSIYDLNNSIPIHEDELEAILQQVLHETPSAFNMQSAYLLILMNQEHERLWDIVTATLKKIVPENSFSSTQDKMNMFKQAKGTILFFDNRNIIEQLKIDFPLYKDNFDTFASHGMGILQGNIWNQLAELNIGASLQHYNPIVDEEVKKQWNIPKEYELCAQMVFGGIQSIPEPKDKIDDKLRYKVYK